MVKSQLIQLGIHPMFSFELFIVSTLKALVEVAALALMAQGLVGFLSGRAKQDNFVYRLFLVVTAPVIKFTRLISPKYIADQHMGIASFFLLFWIWIALIYAKGYVCHAQNLACIPT
jgi:hypothetical protein